MHPSLPTPSTTTRRGAREFFIYQKETWFKKKCQEILVSSEKETPLEFRAKLTFQGSSKDEKLAEATSRSGSEQSERKEEKQERVCLQKSGKELQ